MDLDDRYRMGHLAVNTNLILTGDLTNHNTESTVLSNKQIRQESRLTSLDLNVKYCVLSQYTQYFKFK